VLNILCAHYYPSEPILHEIQTYAKAHNWQIELCGRKIPTGWYGDGVISDYHTLEELSVIRKLEETPVVSKSLRAHDHIRTICPDTVQIARMVVNYFINKGFERITCVSDCIHEGFINDRPIDILNALRDELHHHHIQFFSCIWTHHSDYGNTEEYTVRLKILRDHFQTMERPFALFLPNASFLPIVYRALYAIQLSVPDDVAVLCNTDNQLVTENAIVETSYVGGEHQELGTKLAETLQLLLENKPVTTKPIYVTSSSIVSKRSTDTLAVSEPRLANAVNFFLHNFMKMISVDDAAHKAGLSGKILTRLFHQHFQTSPGKFLTQLRMNRIKHLLDTTDLALSAIAKQTGYGSDMSLSLAFKREYGVTPGEYRRSRRM